MSIYELKGKVAIVTGAGSGIGLAVAELLLAAGSLVVFADLSLQPAAELTLKKYSTSSTDKSSPVVIFHKTDVADWSQLNGLWETTLREFGQIDIIANIAGVYEPPFSDFWRPPGISPESKDQPDANPGSYATISINYVAPVRLAQLAIDYWCRNQVKGNFVAVSSIAAYLHSMHTPLYMSSKAALVSFVKSLGELNDHFGFRFAAVCPGTVTTSLLGNKVGRELSGEGSLTPMECGAVILRVLQEAQWGKGSIVETQKITSDSEDTVSVRDVQLNSLYPTLTTPESILGRIGEDKKFLIARLKDKGMQP